ncbi:hypothetical protein Hanom_Chr07g00592301 [Helianthus anomalus]
MALTWATGVRFGRVTRRNERENELYLAAVWVIVQAEKTLISISFFPFLCFFKYFGHFVFGLVFGPLSFLGPFRISISIYRKSIAGQSDLNHPEGEDDDLAILASYRSKPSLFYIPSSSTFEYVLEKLNKEFELDPTQAYRVEYKASSGQWSSLVCLESCRGMDLIRLRVLPEGREVGWRWKTNS